MRLRKRQQAEGDLPPEAAQEIAEAMARVNEEKRQPAPNPEQTAV